MAQGPEQDLLEPIFPTFLGVSVYPSQEQRKSELVETAYALRATDESGRRRTQNESSVGYTSYFSEARLMERKPFKELADFITTKAEHYARQQRFDLDNYDLVMSSFWVNIQSQYCYLSDHVHPYSHISGVYYLSAPADAGDIVFRDPRPARVMSMPPLGQRGAQNTDVITIAPAEGHVLFFPSWLVHGVRQNLTKEDRISLSFNFDLQPRGSYNAGGV